MCNIQLFNMLHRFLKFDKHHYTGWTTKRHDSWKHQSRDTQWKDQITFLSSLTFNINWEIDLITFKDNSTGAHSATYCTWELTFSESFRRSYVISQQCSINVHFPRSLARNKRNPAGCIRNRVSRSIHHLPWVSSGRFLSRFLARLLPLGSRTITKHSRARARERERERKAYCRRA